MKGVHEEAAPHLKNQLLVDWQEVFPEKTQIEILEMQTTYCSSCGGFKEIGTYRCKNND